MINEWICIKCWTYNMHFTISYVKLENTKLIFESFRSMHELTFVSLTSYTSPFIHVLTAPYTSKVLAINSILPSCSIQFELLLWRGLIFSIKLVVWSFLPSWYNLIPGWKHRSNRRPSSTMTTASAGHKWWIRNNKI